MAREPSKNRFRRSATNYFLTEKKSWSAKICKKNSDLLGLLQLRNAPKTVSDAPEPFGNILKWLGMPGIHWKWPNIIQKSFENILKTYKNHPWMIIHGWSSMDDHPWIIIYGWSSMDDFCMFFGCFRMIFGWYLVIFSQFQAFQVILECFRMILEV